MTPFTCHFTCDFKHLHLSINYFRLQYVENELQSAVADKPTTFNVSSTYKGYISVCSNTLSHHYNTATSTSDVNIIPETQLSSDDSDEPRRELHWVHFTQQDRLHILQS